MLHVIHYHTRAHAQCTHKANNEAEHVFDSPLENLPFARFDTIHNRANKNLRVDTEKSSRISTKVKFAPSRSRARESALIMQRSCYFFQR